MGLLWEGRAWGQHVFPRHAPPAELPDGAGPLSGTDGTGNRRLTGGNPGWRALVSCPAPGEPAPSPCGRRAVALRWALHVCPPHADSAVPLRPPRPAQEPDGPTSPRRQLTGKSRKSRHGAHLQDPRFLPLAGLRRGRAGDGANEVMAVLAQGALAAIARAVLGVVGQAGDADGRGPPPQTRHDGRERQACMRAASLRKARILARARRHAASSTHETAPGRASFAPRSPEPTRGVG